MTRSPATEPRPERARLTWSISSANVVPVLDPGADRHELRVRSERPGELGLEPPVGEPGEDELALTGQPRDERMHAGFEEERLADPRAPGGGAEGRRPPRRAA